MAFILDVSFLHHSMCTLCTLHNPPFANTYALLHTNNNLRRNGRRNLLNPFYSSNHISTCSGAYFQFSIFSVLCTLKSSGVFSTGAMGAMAPVILRKRLIAPAFSTRNGKILLTLGTRNIKILNTPLVS